MTLTDDAVKKCLQQDRELEALRAQLAEARMLITDTARISKCTPMGVEIIEAQAAEYLKKYGG